MSIAKCVMACETTRAVSDACEVRVPESAACAEMRATEMCSAQVFPAKVGSANVRRAEMRPAEMRAANVGTGKLGAAEMAHMNPSKMAAAHATKVTAATKTSGVRFVSGHGER
jgi:hypothetical protein